MSNVNRQILFFKFSFSLCINFQTKLQSMRGEKRSVCGLEASHQRRTCSRTGEAQAAHRAHTACTYFEVVRDTAVSRGALT